MYHFRGCGGNNKNHPIQPQMINKRLLLPRIISDVNLLSVKEGWKKKKTIHELQNYRPVGTIALLSSFATFPLFIFTNYDKYVAWFPYNDNLKLTVVWLAVCDH